MMSRLDELIKELCPNGVAYDKLDSVLAYEQPAKYIVEDTNYDNSFKTPVLTAGQSFILGYTSEVNGIYIATKVNPTIIFDDFTTSFHWVDFSFKIKSSAMKMLRVKPEKIKDVSFRYVYHFMKSIKYEPVDHARQWIAKYSTFLLPVPPLPVQEEIVRILDNFTEATAELIAELTARKKQYEYYRRNLLIFENEISCFPLRNYVDFLNGKGHEKAIDENGKYIVVNSRFISTDGRVKKYSNTQITALFKESILMVMSDLPNGKALAKCYFVDKNDTYTLNQRICSLTVKKNKEVEPKFLYYYLMRNQQLLKYDNGVDQTNLKKDQILDVIIPEIPLTEQRRIVDILDRFDILCNDISSGLPAEIKARQRQYAYYRDKLLTFPMIKLEV